MNLFAEEIENTAILRIQKFAKLAKSMGFEVCLGFSGGKDSQVCYDLCKRAGIKFRAFYNVSFESNVTKRFIRKHYPDVIWRQEHPFGFIRNIRINHKGLLPLSKWLIAAMTISITASMWMIAPSWEFERLRAQRERTEQLLKQRTEP